MLERLYALETFGIKLGLENITRLCEALGHPERAFTCLHVAGTNGKGSVTAMTHAALVAAGLRAARYTSPHLVHLNERFVIGRAPVSDADLDSAAAHVLDRADMLVASGVLPAPPTFFEATTAIAFEIFRRARAHVAVLEVGLGGRFDATNVVAPLATAITSIGLDHQQHLGPTLAAIAFEKAGIIKAGVPVVVAPLPDEADAVVRRVAAERGARLVRTDDGVTIASEAGDGRASVEITTPARRYGRVTLALRGEHQIGNALAAVRLLEEAAAAGLAVPPRAIEEGLERAEWPARLEMLDLGDGRGLLIDAAHNADGAAALGRYLARWHPDRPPLVFAAMEDKDVRAMLAALLPHVGAVIATAPPVRRARTPEALRGEVLAVDPRRVVDVEEDPARAAARALGAAPLACVAGSIFLAGAVRGAFQGRAILR